MDMRDSMPQNSDEPADPLERELSRLQIMFPGKDINIVGEGDSRRISVKLMEVSV